MEPPAGYPDSPMEQDEAMSTCKGCEQVLEEGKAFELAGLRWHIDCFRCHTCGTLLDSDANLLLLGDGSLVCQNCTYSCSSCGDKIEDLAILTGDQAYCANCFRCRSCKKKIENLRYARTSQGMFCMECHDALMSRRRKRSKTNRSKAAQNNAKLDKSLPSLPPEIPSSDAFSPDRGAVSDAYSDTTPIELPGSTPQPRSGSSSMATNRNGKSSSLSQRSELEDTGSFFIPMRLDPSITDGQPEETPKRRNDNDYFSAKTSSSRQVSQEIHPQPVSRRQSDNEALKRSPMVMKQERTDSIATDTQVILGKRTEDRGTPMQSHREGGEGFQLQEAPKNRRSGGSKRTSRDAVVPVGPAALDTAVGNLKGKEPASAPPPGSLSIASPDTSRIAALSAPQTASPRASTDLVRDQASLDLPSLPKRGDSLQKAGPIPERKASALKGTRPGDSPTPGGLQRTQVDYTPRTGDPREAQVSPRGSLGSPRAPLQPIMDAQNKNKEREFSFASDKASSPGLPRHADLIADDFARMVGTDELEGSLMRKASKSARHNRSQSERGSLKDQKWAKPAVNGTAIMGDDFGSPALSPGARDEVARLREENRKVKEELAELQAVVAGKSSINKMNSELNEKRSTIVVLDTKKEVMVRELEVLTNHIATAQKNREPLDMEKLSSGVLRELGASLNKLKESFKPEIEELTEKKLNLQEEVERLQETRDRTMHEFEQLAAKNTQLTEINNNILRQIQQLQMAGGDAQAAALGIYNHQKEKSSISVDSRELKTRESNVTEATLIGDADGDHTILNAPRVVNIRKEQPRRFNWKKGGHMAKDLTRGLKGAFTSESKLRDGSLPGSATLEGIPYSAMQQNIEPTTVLPKIPNSNDANRQGFGFFGQAKNKVPVKLAHEATMADEPEHPSKLFGAELEMRCDWERTEIPSVVTRCIEEVELRGIDQEGIYRRSGGSSQIQAICDGFVQNSDYDISDPDLDIAAVTSALKQYFRKLPTPLITYTVYDVLLSAIKDPSVDERILVMQSAIGDLPSRHKTCLEFLMFHLARVVAMEKTNLMTSQNCAVVFAPTIMRPESIEREMTDTPAKNAAIAFMIEHCQAIFQS